MNPPIRQVWHSSPEKGPKEGKRDGEGDCERDSEMLFELLARGELEEEGNRSGLTLFVLNSGTDVRDLLGGLVED